uniref:Uncharacterized protein n=1 Tax=Moumouvirus sp. 'Monve' TaxID=1128131 RepID=H2EFR5_9VIRU|nr:hypothetical protein mv_L1128 [Moumouvirus Monve]
MLAILIINLYSEIDHFDADCYDCIKPIKISKINKCKNNTIVYFENNKMQKIKFNYV